MLKLLLLLFKKEEAYLNNTFKINFFLLAYDG